MANISIGALGGLDETGKNLYVVMINGDIYIIECGLSYPDRTTPGVDFIIPNVDYLKERKDKIKAYIITHGHDEQFGALLFVYPEIPAPVYLSETTKSAIELFASTYHKLLSNIDFRVVKPTSKHRIGNVDVRFFQTAHCIAESFGVCFETEDGNIIFSSDFITEYTTASPYHLDLPALSEISEQKTLLLMCESMHSDHQGYTSPMHHISPLIESSFRDSKGRHFIAISSQNMYHMQEVFDLSIQYGKRIAFYDKLSEDIYKLILISNPLLAKRIRLLDLEDLVRVREQDIVILMCGMGDKLYHKIDKLISRTNEDKRLFIKPSDTFVFACPANLNNEILATSVIDNLYRTDAEIINITRKKLMTMHASEEDIKMLLSILKPKYYLPIKGEYRHLMSNAKIAVSMAINLGHQNVFLLDNGGLITIKDGNLVSIQDEAMEVSSTLVDGLGVGDVGKRIIDERMNLSKNGLVVCSIAIDRKKGLIVSTPSVEIKGYTTSRNLELMKKNITQLFVDEISKALEANVSDEEEIITSVKDRIKYFLRHDKGYVPTIVPVIDFIA